MKRPLFILVIAAMAACLCATVGWAQSSGNFSYGSTVNANSPTSTRCTLLNDNTGTITGGTQCSLGVTGTLCTTTADCPSGQTCSNPSNGTLTGVCGATAGAPCKLDADCPTGETCEFPGTATTGVCEPAATCVGDLQAGIKTSSGNGNVFVVRPSAVIGLLTDVTLGNNKTNTQIIGTSSALAGVDFAVSVKPLSGQPAPSVIPPYPITYDARFIQISSNLFTVLSSTCTLATGCFITFNESTVSARSFDWIATGLSSGNYGVEVDWTASLGDFGIANSMTCVGPVNLTVQQNKIFNFNTVNSF